MNKLSVACTAAGIGLLLTAGRAGAAEAPAVGEITAAERASYLACYRRVLARPVFALMDSAELYRIREEGLARTVLMACSEEVRPYGRQLLEAATRAPGAFEKESGPPEKSRMFIAYESGLRRRVALDLVEVAPRVKPFADAEATTAPKL